MAAGESPGSLVELSHPTWGAIREVNTPARFSGQARCSHNAAPALGADTEDVLGGYLGYDGGQIAALRRNRVV
jgi:formyl-CoA transferase